MRESLLKRRYGIPAVLLVLLIGIGVVVATGVTVLNITGNISYPTHGSLSIDLGNISAGGSASRSENGFIGLPDGTYDLTWTLSGDTDNFSSISIDVWVDLKKNGHYESKDNIGTLTKQDTSISKTGVSGVLETTVKYDVDVTAANGVRNSSVGIASESYDLVVSWNATRQ